MIDMKKQYKTRNGKPVRILATNLGGTIPVAAAITSEDGSEHIWQLHSTGRLLSGGESSIDLIEVKPVREGWVNVYNCPRYPVPALDGAVGFSGTAYRTQEEANAYSKSSSGRIACIKIQFTEGEGL